MMSFILISLFLLFLFIERIMTAKGSFVQQRSASADPMKISSLLNDQTLACPQNLLPISHELPQGPESARFLAVNTSASSVQEDGKSTPTIEAEEPSSASFRGRGRFVASQDEPAATSEDTWPPSGRRRGATAIADDENPKARPKRMRGASEALDIERHLWKRFTEEEVHFIWYYRVVLLKRWEEIYKSFNGRFTPRKNPSCLQDKLLRLTRKRELPARPKKDQEQIHDGEVRRASSHATIKDVVEICESLGYSWMKGTRDEW
ncbi:unnamed protein product [Penicillium salamii]|uniref:Uncharacterized protein n=1 Tax=Penicillium salamii TaxID=1612424 RepID=A0A9W4I6H0_9EURO|nr:unnamed protein product [Penicillium salamii]CAG8381939.1 unnamed protein product [Penicillium salamii]CAG8418830.1 unnamed protein product [Penicillium salamii]CAG8586888.1 unnamed protein product [Penicillium salamii]